MEEAFEWFDKAFHDRSFELISINVDPGLDALRQDSRFKAMVKKVGFLLD